MLALLGGALREGAPDWLLQTAIDQDLKRTAEPHWGAPMELASAALSNPSCTDTQRTKTLRRCSVPQLGSLGRAGCGKPLADGIAAELRQRGPHSQPMTPELLQEPAAAQMILRKPDVHDVIFAMALDLLPTFPRPTHLGEGEDSTAWWNAFKAAKNAWERMWEQVVSTHTARHRQLVAWSEESDANHIIRRHLLGTIPWDVEPSLLEEIAKDDLARFRDSSLLTRMCRMFRDSASEQRVRSHFADDLGALAPDRLQHFEDYLSDVANLRKYGEHATTSWMENAAEGSWRYILNPTDAKHRYGDPHTWSSPDELLRDLGRRFAEAGVEALKLWEPQNDTAYRTQPDLRWVHATLVHLAIVSDEVEDQVRTVLKDFRPDPYTRAHDYTAQNKERLLSETRASIVRIIGDPSAAARKSALGDPNRVTVRDLAGATGEVLEDYLTRHAGNDDLVEKALIAFASGSYRPNLTFADVLARHSAPQAALMDITTGLRRRLGGSPGYREAWAREVLALPDTNPELIRALPAWTALTVGGSSRYGTTHQAVTTVVMNALGDSDKAWTRFASSPASYSGPTAWLRLGDVLDASIHGTPWPTPPSTR
ncbi:hypothetical protein QMK19_02095 [Streptomyces sp. H10-C2]|uniref:hypothetical protein n=1 Tax=unclassified Streptomyces TaxID=2593676 RepID=UPI0024BA9DD6|nr:MULTISPECIES: hypothetical protein [unclassified Streptomyces]MDJ0342643.1 hypothetical protein [Streptomyces sp. PH10-H1]MDJ0368503.1 hypothetical protein [Streptomyces sp. H10-C2]